jgi:hypothetical protein
VYNEAGELVKEILVGRFPQPLVNIQLDPGHVIDSLHGENSSIGIYNDGVLIGSWDGTNRDGTPVSNGNYFLKVDNVGAYGDVTTVTRVVKVDRVICRVTILIYNEAGEVVRSLVAILDDSGMPQPLSMELSAAVIQPSLEDGGRTPREVEVVLNNGVTVVWEGKSDAGSFVQNGQYFIEANSVNGRGTQSTVVKAISVLGADRGKGIGRITATPNVLNGTKGYKAVFKVERPADTTLKATIYTVAGELVARQQGRAGANEVAWDASRVVSGLYLAVVEQVDHQGGRVSRQIQKIAVIR